MYRPCMLFLFLKDTDHACYHPIVQSSPYLKKEKKNRNLPLNKINGSSKGIFVVSKKKSTGDFCDYGNSNIYL